MAQRAPFLFTIELYRVVPTLTPTVGFKFIELQPTKVKLKHNTTKILFMNQSLRFRLIEQSG